MKLPTREQLVKRRAIVLQNMAAKMEAEDFHGVADCAMDAREIDAMLSALTDTPADVEAIALENESLRARNAMLESRLYGLGDQVIPWTITEPVRVGDTIEVRIPAEWRVRV